MFAPPKGVSSRRDLSFLYSFVFFHSFNFRCYGYNISCIPLNPTPRPFNVSYFPWLVIYYTNQNGLLYTEVKLSSCFRNVQCRPQLLDDLCPQPWISKKANCNQSHDIALTNRFCSTSSSYGVQVNED